MWEKGTGKLLLPGTYVLLNAGGADVINIGRREGTRLFMGMSWVYDKKGCLYFSSVRAFWFWYFPPPEVYLFLPACSFQLDDLWL